MFAFGQKFRIVKIAKWVLLQTATMGFSDIISDRVHTRSSPAEQWCVVTRGTAGRSAVKSKESATGLILLYLSILDTHTG